MRDISKELFLFLSLVAVKLKEESDEIYKNNLLKWLQEDSNSFGFKPFSELEDYIISELSSIYKNDFICDYFFDEGITFWFDEKPKEKILIKNSIDLYDYANFCLIEETNNKNYILEERGVDFKLKSNIYFNKTKELLVLLESVMKKLTDIEHSIGEEIKMLLTDLQEDTARHSFHPAYKIKELIYENIDKFTLRIENNWINLDDDTIEELFNRGSGLFYLYCEESHFGKNKITLYKKDSNNSLEIKEESFNDFLSKYLEG